MIKVFFQGRWRGRVERGVRGWGAVFALAMASTLSMAAQSPYTPLLPKDVPQPIAAVKASQEPSFSIPVDPLGFAAPGAFYLGQRNSMVSLDFLDEDRLLFTFRVPGLLRRDAQSTSEERQIRAVVLSLPTGTVLAEALWTVHDRARYLWMLKDCHFLLRDGDEIKLGDGSLELKPYLRFPGPLLWMEMDPSQRFLVADSREKGSKPGTVASPSTAAVDMTVDGDQGTPDTVVRILKRDSGQVLLLSHTHSAVHLPINGDGYLESLRSHGIEWSLNLNYFTGGSMVLGRLVSTCAPSYNVLSSQEVLATVCDTLGGSKLVALSTDGKKLWENFVPDNSIWPLLVNAPDGSRLARETLSVNHVLTARSPLSTEDIRGQLVEVFDAANGKRALTVQITPPLDAGGNIAFSPSGRRVAALSAGAIQIFDLAPAAPLVNAANIQNGR